MLNIKISSWHYKLYNWVCDVLSVEDRATSLCGYILPITSGPPLIVGMYLMMVSLTLLSTPLALMIGWRPSFTTIRREPFVPYNGLKVAKNFRLYPGHLVLLGFIGWTQYLLFHYCNPVVIIAGDLI